MKISKKIPLMLDNFFGHLADYERFMCAILNLQQTPGIFLGGTIIEIFKLKFLSLVRTPAAFVLVICGPETETCVSSAFMEVKLLAM